MELKFEKIPCPNCENKLLAMISGVNDGVENYKCQVCKAVVTYDHRNKKVLKIVRKGKTQ